MIEQDIDELRNNYSNLALVVQKLLKLPQSRFEIDQDNRKVRLQISHI